MKTSRFLKGGSRGLTMVELLVSMAVTGIVTAAAVSIFTAQHRNFVRDQNVKEITQDAQEVIRVLKGDLMEAGFGTQTDMAFFIEDGGNARSDKIYINDISLIQLQPHEDWDDPDVIPDDMERFISRPCPACVNITSGMNTSSVQVESLFVSDGGCTSKNTQSDCDALSKCQWDSGACSRRNDFVGGVFQFVLSDSGTGKVAKINSIGGNTLQLDRALGGTVVAPAIHYCVDDGNADCHPANGETRVLRRSDRTTGGRQPLVENVMDLQVAYQDADGFWYGTEGCAGTGLGAGRCQRNPFDSGQIGLIRMSLLVRGNNQDRTRMDDPNTCRPALENRPGTDLGNAAQRNAECGFVYRVYEVVLKPRNAG